MLVTTKKNLKQPVKWGISPPLGTSVAEDDEAAENPITPKKRARPGEISPNLPAGKAQKKLNIIDASDVIFQNHTEPNPQIISCCDVDTSQAPRNGFAPVGVCEASPKGGGVTNRIVMNQCSTSRRAAAPGGSTENNNFLR